MKSLPISSVSKVTFDTESLNKMSNLVSNGKPLSIFINNDKLSILFTFSISLITIVSFNH